MAGVGQDDCFTPNKTLPRSPPPSSGVPAVVPGHSSPPEASKSAVKVGPLSTPADASQSVVDLPSSSSAPVHGIGGTSGQPNQTNSSTIPFSSNVNVKRHNKNKTRDSKTVLCPPIICLKANNYKILQNTIKAANIMCPIRILKSGDYLLQCSSKADNVKLCEKFKVEKIEFYSFKPNDEKTIQYVFRGLHPDTDVAEFKEELLSLGFNAVHIHNAKPTKVPLRLFFIDFSVS